MSPLFYVLGVLLLLLIPLLPGFLELYQKTDIAALGINRLHTGNANIFAVNYRRHLSALEQKGQGTDWVARFARLEAQQRPVITEEVRAQGYLRIPAGFHCLTEVYCNGDISTGMGVILRSALAEGNLNLGVNNTILRWAGAQRIRVASGCSLFGRLVADKSLFIDGAVSFQRIQAPLILLGCGWDRKPSPPPAMEVDISHLPDTLFYNAAMRRAVVAGDVTLPAHSLLRGNLVVRGQLLIGDGCCIDGSIKAGGKVYIGNNVVINGSVVSDHSVDCLAACHITGHVVAARQVSIGAGAVLGRPDAAISLSSRFVLLKLPMVIHGTVWARKRGKVLGL